MRSPSSPKTTQGNERKPRWYLERNLVAREAAWLTLALAVVFLLLELSPAGEWIQRQIARPLEFRARHALGRDLRLDDRIAVYALGDSSLGALGAQDVTLGEWAKLFTALDRAGASAIFVDKWFSLEASAAETKAFVAAVGKLSRPPITGAFALKTAAPQRAPLDLQRPEYDIREWAADGRGVSLRSLDWLPRHELTAYGAHPSLAVALRRAGHLMYEADSLSFPFLRLESDRVLPMAALLVRDDVKIGARGITIGGTRIPVDSRGRVVVDFPSPDVLSQKLQSFGALIGQLRKEGKVTIPRGAVVVLLTSMSTGTPQLVGSPWGTIPSGYVQLSLIQSVLGGNWISTVPAAWLLVLLALFCGGFLGIRAVSSPFWGALASGTLGLVALGLASFAFAGLALPWLPMALAFFSGAMTLQVRRLRNEGRKAASLREALEGVLPPDKLDSLLTQTDRKWLEPTNRVVSVLFLDVVGFSLLCERKAPREVFDLLKAVYAEITETIHRWGGVVDKTLGDGVLCFFGLPDETGSATHDHADRAIGCALELQRRNAARIVAAREGEPIFPFRIGINTAAVVLGDIGSTRRVDLTIIGHGVNLANRLESACEPFMVLIGPTTASMLLAPHALGGVPRKRFVPMKHMAVAQEAFEVDPFRGNEETLQKAIAAYRSFARLERREERLTPTVGGIVVECGAYGRGELVNFSASGLCVKVATFLGHGVLVDCRFAVQRVGELESVEELPPLICEVRWGRPLDDYTFIHGLRIKNLTEAQRASLLAGLKRLCSPPAAPLLKLVK